MVGRADIRGLRRSICGSEGSRGKDAADRPERKNHAHNQLGGQEKVPGAPEEVPGLTRLFVGGLPSNVRATELRSLFGSFGAVHGVELVGPKDSPECPFASQRLAAAQEHYPAPPARALSKPQPQNLASPAVGEGECRGFAYVDLEPKTAKHLHLCLSLYNGCKWRGGHRLRVEKARVSPLVALQQEWAQRGQDPGEPGTGDSAAPGPDAVGGGTGLGAGKAPGQGRRPGEKLSPLRLEWAGTKRVKLVPADGGAAGSVRAGRHRRSFPALPAHSVPALESMLEAAVTGAGGVDSPLGLRAARSGEKFTRTVLQAGESATLTGVVEEGTRGDEGRHTGNGSGAGERGGKGEGRQKTVAWEVPGQGDHGGAGEGVGLGLGDGTDEALARLAIAAERKMQAQVLQRLLANLEPEALEDEGSAPGRSIDGEERADAGEEGVAALGTVGKLQPGEAQAEGDTRGGDMTQLSTLAGPGGGESDDSIEINTRRGFWAPRGVEHRGHSGLGAGGGAARGSVRVNDTDAGGVPEVEKGTKLEDSLASSPKGVGKPGPSGLSGWSRLFSAASGTGVPGEGQDEDDWATALRELGGEGEEGRTPDEMGDEEDGGDVLEGDETGEDSTSNNESEGNEAPGGRGVGDAGEVAEDEEDVAFGAGRTMVGVRQGRRLPRMEGSSGSGSRDEVRRGQVAGGEVEEGDGGDAGGSMDTGDEDGKENGLELDTCKEGAAGTGAGMDDEEDSLEVRAGEGGGKEGAVGFAVLSRHQPNETYDTEQKEASGTKQHQPSGEGTIIQGHGSGGVSLARRDEVAGQQWQQQWSWKSLTSPDGTLAFSLLGSLPRPAPEEIPNAAPVGSVSRHGSPSFQQGPVVEQEFHGEPVASLVQCSGSQGKIPQDCREPSAPGAQGTGSSEEVSQKQLTDIARPAGLGAVAVRSRRKDPASAPKPVHRQEAHRVSEQAVQRTGAAAFVRPANAEDEWRTMRVQLKSQLKRSKERARQ